MHPHDGEYHQWSPRKIGESLVQASKVDYLKFVSGAEAQQRLVAPQKLIVIKETDLEGGRLCD